MNIAIIPARGGSKRIPRKNIKLFNGKPMIAWSIEVAKHSQCFDDIIVSTDDEEIAEVARQYGASVPFMRPQNLADDYATTVDVMAYTVDALRKLNNSPLGYVCCIYATAPFIQAKDIGRAYDLIRKSNVNFVFSVTSYPFPIQRALRLNSTYETQMFNPEHFATRSQDLEEAFHDAGQFYWGKPQAWVDKRSIFDTNGKAVILPRYRVQDIDTQEDWEKAELMFKYLTLEK